MMLRSFILATAIVTTTFAQSETSITISGTNTVDPTGAEYRTEGVSYSSYESTISLTESDYETLSGTQTATALSSNTLEAQNITTTINGAVIVTPSPTETLLTASRESTSVNGTALRTTADPARPTKNTQPCNGYPEFCARSYSNITHIAAHNSPFSIQGNIASNQALDVQTQLNDGIRMLQFQVHKPNATSPLMLCHTSCDLLDAGTLVDYLTTVREWLDDNPYDVVTILMGNYDVLTPQNFTAPIYDSGLIRYAYTPPTVPMSLDQWPTLSEMIIKQRRAVIMLDYEADQVAIPWLLDEFANAWETPFSPTDRDFPCDVQRPPDQDPEISRDRLYIVNQNLNVELNLGAISLMIPASTLLNETNAVEGYGSAGVTSQNCTRDWNRPPNFILVDFYNVGSFNGSIFQVAADANGVTYDRDSCCGTNQRQLGAASVVRVSGGLVAAGVAVIAWLMI